MGVINLTPDSFSDGGKHNTVESALRRAEEMVRDGVDIIDLGGESTRPYSKSISFSEEIDRVIPSLKAIAGSSDIPLSCDTSKASVAEEALKNGAFMINDVSAGQDPDMFSTVSEHNADICLMHMRGRPENMQDAPVYDDLLKDIKDYLYMKTEQAEYAGIAHDNIIIDPGIGFGKTAEDNFKILRSISFFSGEYPILVGASRKSFIGKLTGSDADERLGGSIAVACWLAMEGVEILRVHDTKETRQAVNIIKLLKECRK